MKGTLARKGLKACRIRGSKYRSTSKRLGGICATRELTVPTVATATNFLLQKFHPVSEITEALNKVKRLSPQPPSLSCHFYRFPYARIIHKNTAVLRVVHTSGRKNLKKYSKVKIILTLRGLSFLRQNSWRLTCYGVGVRMYRWARGNWRFERSCCLNLQC